MKRTPLSLLGCLTLVVCSGSPLAQAQTYPQKPVKVVVAFTAGGTTDILARTVAQQLSEKLKQPFVIDNKPGAGGNLGTEMVVRAAPDGYTLIVNSVGPIAVNPSLHAKLPYNPLTGKLKPMAVSSLKRSRSMPDVPTVVEKGLPNFEAGSWFGFFAPKGTPESVINVVNKAVNEVLQVPAIEQQMVAQGADPAGGTAAQFGQFVQREHDKWRLIVRDSGARAE